MRERIHARVRRPETLTDAREQGAHEAHSPRTTVLTSHFGQYTIVMLENNYLVRVRREYLGCD